MKKTSENITYKIIIYQFSILLLTLLLASITSFSQSENQTNSIRPILDKDVMWKKRYTRIIDLREKQNKPFMAQNMELTKYLVAGILAGKLTPYKNDSLSTTMSINSFTKKLTIPSFNGPDEEEIMDEEDGWDIDIDMEEETVSQYYFPNQLYVIEMTEDAIFDKEESKMKYDIQSLTLYIPADLADNIRGIQDHLVSLSYKQCVQYINSLKVPVWFNTQNDQEYKYFSSAFDLRLFSSHIVKVSNPNNEFLEDTYGTPEKGMIASEIEKYKLTELESNFWEN